MKYVRPRQPQPSAEGLPLREPLFYSLVDIVLICPASICQVCSVSSDMEGQKGVLSELTFAEYLSTA